MNPRVFFAELKRRNVYKVAVAYAVVAWLLIQAASIVFPTFDAPAWVMKVVVVVVAIGFPIALIIAWAFEMTPQGMKRTEEISPNESISQWSLRKFAALIIGVALAAAGLLAFQILRTRAPAATTDTDNKSIAVLPFESLSDDKTNAYFVDGMQDEVITRLAKISELRVISRTSTQRYKTRASNLPEIARELGVSHLVEGTVQRVGERVRINVQLIRAANEGHLWAEIYDRNLTDIFAVQSELATAIAHALQAKLTGEEKKAVAEKPTSNMAAYDAYLRGIDFYSRPGQMEDSLRKAADAHAEAVRLDPQFAQAWAALAIVHADINFLQLDTSAQRKESARGAAENAARLNAMLPETLLANAYYRYHVERDYEGARLLFEKIHREMPSNSEALAALARIARRQSRWNDSLRLYEEAAKLNPRDTHLVVDRAWTFSMLRQHAATADMLERALAISPDDPEVLVNKVKHLQVTGDLPAARAVMERIPANVENKQAEDVRVVQFILERRFAEAARYESEIASRRKESSPADHLFIQQFLGWTRLLAGDADGAKQAYQAARNGLETLLRDQPDNPFVVSTLAMVEAQLGNKEAALREATRAVAILPQSSDPVYGPIFEEYLAAVETQVGEIESALARIERLLTTPYGAFPLSQATLRLDPVWDRLRSHPRFKALVEGPEPKTIYH